MASRIQGITVEIGGDTTKLTSALQGVNKEIKSTQSQLKDVEKLLKLDPSNTELVSQKQKLLAQAISETKEKLATLKTAAEQANEQLQKGEITQEQYDALQREIQETEQALRNLESQASTTNATLNKIEEVGGKFEQVGQKITSAGKTLSTYVTAPIVAAGTAAVKTAADFDEGIAQEESRSISTNNRWGKDKRYPKGDVPNFAIYGYRFTGEYETTESGYRRKEIEIVDKEAETVRRIFQLYTSGVQPTSIARKLNAERIPAPGDKDTGWTAGRLTQILKSERYCGDVLLQKTYTADFLTHEVKVNEGELPQYYIKDHHPAIISRQLYEKAQTLGKTMKKKGENASFPLSRRIVCGHCGKNYIANNSRLHRTWRCGSTVLNNGMDLCTAETLKEEEILLAVRMALKERFPSYANLQASLESTQEFDYVETDRNIMKKQILAMDFEIAELEEQKEAVTAENDVSILRRDLLDEKVDESDLQRLVLRRKSLEDKADALRKEKASLETTLNEKECFWELMERDYEEREKTVAFMKTAGADEFYAQIGEHIKALVISITVHSPRHFTVLWFDGTSTEVTK